MAPSVFIHHYTSNKGQIKENEKTPAVHIALQCRHADASHIFYTIEEVTFTFAVRSIN
jgi:hypothetical protein